MLGQELKAQAADHSHWKYQSISRIEGQERTKEVVESRDGDVDGLLAINGHPLTLSQRRKEEQRIRKLAGNPGEQRKRREDQTRDARNAERMLKILPDAVIASYGARDGDLIELDFKPNPEFRPQSHEDQVFHAMEGKIWLNVRENRLAEIDGHLTHSIKFAGGLLGHLDSGGKFQVKQSEIGAHYWDVTLLRVEMKGKALFFKTIAVHQDESHSDYQRVPDNLTLSQACAELEEEIRAASPR